MVGQLRTPSHGLLFLPTADPRGWRDKSGRGDKRRRRREGSGQGNRGWMVVRYKDQTNCNAGKRKKEIHSILHTQSPASQPPSFSLSAPPGRGQTSTDWIWFICARIIWTLLRIFFWWPANVTPTLKMSLWGQTEADVKADAVACCLSVYFLPRQRNITR